MISPVLKCDDPSDPNNYRLISATPVSKVIETVIFDQLRSFLERETTRLPSISAPTSSSNGSSVGPHLAHLVALDISGFQPSLAQDLTKMSTFGF